jgi:septum formation protein
MLSDIGIVAQGIPADIDEESITHLRPVETAQKRAQAKAENVYLSHPNALVIGADQVVYVGLKIFSKPKSEEEWFERLQYLRGQSHLLTTAVSIKGANEPIDFIQTTQVKFRGDLSDESLWAYVKHGEAWGCAGGYMMEGRGAWLIESIQGDWQNVIGLPIFPLITHLRSLGYINFSSFE